MKELICKCQPMAVSAIVTRMATHRRKLEEPVRIARIQQEKLF